MANCNNNVIKLLWWSFTSFQILWNYCKLLCFFIKTDPTDWCSKTNLLPKIWFCKSSYHVIKYDCSWRIRCNRLAKMFLKCIISELQALFGSIWPQIPIHTTMYGFPVLVSSSSPCVIPKSSPIFLFLEANNVWDFLTFFLCCLKSSELC